MSRLTKKYPNGFVTLDADNYTETQETADGVVRNSVPVMEAVKILAEYEDAEEQGLLVRLPCKVGDTVYFFSDVLEEVCEAKVIKVEKNYYTPSRMFWFTIEYFSKLIGTQVLHKPISEALNNTVFLTREDAEQALKDR